MDFCRLFCVLAGVWILGGSVSASPAAAEPSPSASVIGPHRQPAEDEHLGAVPEPSTWAAGSIALALTLYLFLRRAKAWDQRAERRG